MSMQDGRDILFRDFARGCKPRPRLTVSEWADQYRVLTGKSAQRVGQWRTSLTPYAREPMDMLSLHSPARKVVVMSAIQMLKTEIGLNWLGYIIDYAPAPTLSVQPTLELRDRYVLQRIHPMLESSPRLAEKFNAKAKRDASNSRDIKDFPGGLLVLGGANSPSSLASMPIKYVVADEVDRFPPDVGGEGDPLGLIEGRQSNFSRSKILVISSPTMKGASVIESEYEGGDRRQYSVPCPHCGEMQPLIWKQLHWRLADGLVCEVWYVCPHCGSEIEELHKRQMLDAGRWIAERDGPYPSYRINALYSPIGLGLSWRELAQQWIKAQDDRIKLKRFINVRLAETWSPAGAVEWHALRDRAEELNPVGTVPAGCLLLAAGIDTQNNRLAVQILGFGRKDAVWVIDYVELMGDPLDVAEQFCAGQGALHDYLAQPRLNHWGKALPISAVGWDTGGQRTDAVYTMVRSKRLPRLMALKGSSSPGRQILASRPSEQDVNWRGKTIKKGVQLWLVGTDTAKDWLVGRLAADAEREPAQRRIRFPAGLPDDYFKGLLAESYDPEQNKWVKKRGERNEPLDTAVYALAASRHPEVRLHAMTEHHWDALERRLQPGGLEALGASTAPVVPPAEQEPAEVVHGFGRGISLKNWGRG